MASPLQVVRRTEGNRRLRSQFELTEFLWRVCCGIVENLHNGESFVWTGIMSGRTCWLGWHAEAETGSQNLDPGGCATRLRVLVRRRSRKSVGENAQRDEVHGHADRGQKR